MHLPMGVHTKTSTQWYSYAYIVSKKLEVLYSSKMIGQSVLKQYCGVVPTLLGCFFGDSIPFIF